MINEKTPNLDMLKSIEKRIKFLESKINMIMDNLLVIEMKNGQKNLLEKWVENGVNKTPQVWNKK